MQIEPLSLFIPKELPEGTISSFFEAAKYEIRQNMDGGAYFTPVENALYIYRISTQHSSHLGVIALNDVSDFWAGKIKKHEKTLTRREQEYVDLLQDWQAVIKPVLLTYPANRTITDWLTRFSANHTPIVDLAVDGEERHQLWAVVEPAELDRLQSFFKELVDSVYIADGHHRTTTIANMSKKPKEACGGLNFSKLFCAYFSEDQLAILGYHRLLTLSEGMTTAQLMGEMHQWFEIEPLSSPRLPRGKRELVVLTSVGQFCLRPKVDVDRTFLDASLLNEFVFSRILGMEDIRSASGIRYVEGSISLQALSELVSDAGQVLFLLYPVSFDDLFYLSDQGLDLPPKSTWFEPRIKSGLAVHSLVDLKS
jgi:uncharacterized protein (DUF1015 family)